MPIKGNLFSEAEILNCGVPRGSILVLLLILIYINDLPPSLSESGSCLYADDTCIFYQDNDVHKIVDVLNEEFSTLCEWFADNMLSIHFGKEKTKCSLFSKIKRLAKVKYISGRSWSQVVSYCRIFRVSPWL